MKKTQQTLVSQLFLRSISIKQATNIILTLLLIIPLVLACTKEDKPDPKPIIKSQPNPITEMQTPVASLDKKVGEVFSLARYKGKDAFDKELVAAFEVSGDAFEVKKHPTYPNDSLQGTVLKKGSGKIDQFLTSAQQVENADINNDGIPDKITHTATEKKATTMLNGELAKVEAENTVALTNEAEIPATLSVETDVVYEISKLAGTAQKGETVHTVTTNNDGLIAWLASSDETKLKFKAVGEGTIIVTQKIASETVLETEDKDGNGEVDTETTYKQDAKEKTTTIEAKEVVFGLNEAGIAELQEYFRGKLVELPDGETLHIDYNQILTYPDDLKEAAVSLGATVKVSPRGVIPHQPTRNQAGYSRGMNFELNHDYRGDDLQITITFDIDGQDYTAEFPIPRGVSLDVSDEAEVASVIKERFIDLFGRVESGAPRIDIEKFVSVSPTLYIRGGNASHRAKMTEAIADLNQTLAQAGATTADGVPLRITFTDDESASNVVLFFGDPAAFEQQFNVDIGGRGGAPVRTFKDGKRSTGEIIGGGAYRKINAGNGVQGEVAGMIQELMHLLGMSGELDRDPTSISTIVGYNTIANMKDKAAIMMLYNGNVPAAQRIKPGLVVDALPLLDNLVQEVLPTIIQEVNAQ